VGAWYSDQADKMDRTCGIHGEERLRCGNLKETDNLHDPDVEERKIKKGFKEIVCKGMEWILLAQEETSGKLF